MLVFFASAKCGTLHEWGTGSSKQQGFESNVTNGLFALAWSESHKNHIMKSLYPQCLDALTGIPFQYQMKIPHCVA